MCLPSRLSIIQVSFTHLNYIFRNTDNYNVLSLELGTQGILVRTLRSPIPFFLKKKNPSTNISYLQFSRIKNFVKFRNFDMLDDQNSFCFIFFSTKKNWETLHDLTATTAANTSYIYSKRKKKR
jgi:hypothetical protein